MAAAISALPWGHLAAANVSLHFTGQVPVSSDPDQTAGPLTPACSVSFHHLPGSFSQCPRGPPCSPVRAAQR